MAIHRLGNLFMPDDDFRPTCGIEMLRSRCEAIRQTRRFFFDRGFIEVDTPTLSRDTVIDMHLDPIVVPMHAARPGSPMGTALYLQTSPEFCMKRILAAGGDRIFQIAHAYRRDEMGDQHNVEFQMLEWYEVGIVYPEARKFLGDLLHLHFDFRTVRERTYRQVFLDLVGLDPYLAMTDDLRLASESHATSEIANASDFKRDDWLNLLFSQTIQPSLGSGDWIDIVFDWPSSQSALAQVRDDDWGEPVAERFEAFVDGLELANGYHELLSAEELIARNRHNNEERLRLGREVYPIESRLTAAMRAGLPSCCGVALGIDRLLMAKTGATGIGQVMAFPFDIA